MDRAEAIAWFETALFEPPLLECRSEVYRMAIAALREQEQSNEPLTFEQLWDMHGEPIWIVWLDGRIKSKWWIVGSHEWHMMEFTDAQSAKEYGTVWIAYRHKLGGAGNA